MLGRIAPILVRRRKTVIGLWILFFVASIAFGSGVIDKLETDAEGKHGTEAGRVLDELEALGQNQPDVVGLLDGRAPLPVDPFDGESLLPLLAGSARGAGRTIFAEYLGEGTLNPAFMVRRGRYKYIACDGDPPQLYDLEADPKELVNRAGARDLAAIEADLSASVTRRWNAPALRRAVIESQNRRLFVHKVLLTGRPTPWDFQPHRNAATSYVRNFGVAEDTLKALARLPAVEPVPPDA